MDAHKWKHSNNNAAVVSDGSVGDANPLIRQLLLACDALEQSLNEQAA
jgi:hypothetical protein